MGTSLFGLKPKNTYQGLLKTTANTAIDATLRTISDGLGNDTPLQLSLTDTQINSTLRVHTDNAELLDLEDVASNNRFNINRAVQKINLDFASRPGDLTTVVGAIRTATDGVNLAEVMSFRENGQIYINQNFSVGTTTTTGARTTIKGSGSGATISLLVQNSASATTLSVRDDGAISGIGSSVAYTENIGAFYTGGAGTQGLEIGRGSGSTNRLFSGTANLRVYNNSGVGVNTPVDRGGSLSVRGFGSTSATTALLVENSAGNAALYIKDDLTSSFGNKVGILKVTPADCALDVNGSIFFSSNNFIASGNTFGVPNKIVLYNGANGDIDITMWNPGWYIRHNANMSMAGNLNVGNNTTGTARLQVKGSGATAATTALLVQNSAGTQLLKFTDDASLTISSGGTADFQGNVSLRGVVDSGTGSNNLRFVAAGATKSVLINADYSNSNAASAMLEVQSTTKGFLPPRMTTAQKNAILTPAAGLMVYDTDLNKLCVRTAAAWETITSI